MVTLNSTTYGARTGQTFDTTNWPTQSIVSGWCTSADEQIEAVAGTDLSNARSAAGLRAIAVIIVERIQRRAEDLRLRGEDDTGQPPRPVEIDPRSALGRMIAKAFEPDELPFGTFKTVKDRID